MHFLCTLLCLSLEDAVVENRFCSYLIILHVLLKHKNSTHPMQKNILIYCLIFKCFSFFFFLLFPTHHFLLCKHIYVANTGVCPVLATIFAPPSDLSTRSQFTSAEIWPELQPLLMCYLFYLAQL